MELEQIRAQIDRVDEHLVELFRERMRLSAEIAALKRQAGLPLTHKTREEEILTRVSEQAGAELEAYIRILFSTLFSLSKSYQARLNTAEAPLSLSDSEELSAHSDTNIVLIGMPGCGKSCIGAELARLTGRPLFDTDDMVIELAGQSIPEIFSVQGEAVFREWERQTVAQAADNRGSIIATGGGTVLTEENCRMLEQNGCFYFIERALNQLPLAGRPLSINLPALYAERLPVYQALAAATINNDGTIEQAARRVLAAHQNRGEY